MQIKLHLWARILSSASASLLLLIIAYFGAGTHWLGLSEVLFVPGLLLAALIFPQGPHGDWPNIYLLVALIIDFVLFTLLILGMWRILCVLKPSDASDVHPQK